MEPPPKRRKKSTLVAQRKRSSSPAVTKKRSKANPVEEPGDILSAGYRVAALVEGKWILATILGYSNGKYSVEDADDEETLRYSLGRNELIPTASPDRALPLVEYNFKKGDRVLAVFPDTTCFYQAVVNGKVRPIRWKVTGSYRATRIRKRGTSSRLTMTKATMDAFASARFRVIPLSLHLVEGL